MVYLFQFLKVKRKISVFLVVLLKEEEEGNKKDKKERDQGRAWDRNT
jgi:hypothetical protein